MFETKQNPGDQKLEAPETLIKALEDNRKERLFIPPHIDAAILTQATSHLARMRQKQLRQRVVAKWAALAAALLLLASIIPFVFKMQRGPAYDTADVNRDGRVDILDALLVARNSTPTAASSRQWDFNHDGLVDRRDAETVARVAVKLGKTGPS